MKELQKQVRRARRRLGLRRFAGVLGWCWSATLAVALGLIVLGRLYPVDVDAWIWGLGALGLGLVMAGAWMAATRREPLDAAIEIDRRFALKERVSSTLAMGPEDRQSEAGRALAEDAAGRVGRIDVAERFAAAPPGQFLLPLLPGVLAVLVAVLPSPARTEDPKPDQPQPPPVNRQVQNSTSKLREELARCRDQAEKKGLEELKRLLGKLEDATRDMADGKIERKEALVKLNKLGGELQQRRNKLGGTDKIRNQLSQLKDIGPGPAERFAKAVRQGDLEEAADALEKIHRQLANNELGDEQKQKLAEQLDQIQQKLSQVSQQHRQVQEQLQQRIDRLRQAGRPGEAGQLQQQLDRLLEQLPQMEQLGQMARTLQRCGDYLRNAEFSDAAEALRQLQADLQQQLAETELIEEVMERLRQARAEMNCRRCEGSGCPACRGSRPGVGTEPARAQGARPEEEPGTALKDSPVKPKLDKEGAWALGGLVPGPNVKGDAAGEIRQQFDAARRGSADPLTGHRIPREHERHVREYFERLRKGK